MPSEVLRQHEYRNSANDLINQTPDRSYSLRSYNSSQRLQKELCIYTTSIKNGEPVEQTPISGSKYTLSRVPEENKREENSKEAESSDVRQVVNEGSDKTFTLNSILNSPLSDIRSNNQNLQPPSVKQIER